MLTATTAILHSFVLLLAWPISTVVHAAAQVGALCNTNEDCATQRCFQGFSPTKVCACNSNTHAGCPAGQMCSDAPIAYDGLPECRNPGSLLVGVQCQVDADCQSLRCYYGEQLPGTPGTCACNANFNNAGCPEGWVCFDEPTFTDGLPECRVGPGGAGPIGDDCQNDSDCDSRRCFPSRMVGLPGSCRCNADTNAGCVPGQTCSDDPIAYDGLPECVVQPGGGLWNTIAQVFLSMWQILIFFLRSLIS